jgi:hypothetical protein
MPFSDKLTALNLDPAMRKRLVAELCPFQADAQRLCTRVELDALKIQVLTLELAQIERQLIAQQQHQISNRRSYQGAASEKGIRNDSMGPSRPPHISSWTHCCTSTQGNGGTSCNRSRK